MIKMKKYILRRDDLLTIFSRLSGCIFFTHSFFPFPVFACSSQSEIQTAQGLTAELVM